MNPLNKKVNETEYSIQTAPDTVRVMTDPHNPKRHIIHAYVPIRNFPSGEVSDRINPRSHEKLPVRLAETIEESLKENPDYFHILNRGVLVLADRARYDDATKTLTFTVSDNDTTGLADGATTDRVLSKIKNEIPDFQKLKREQLPPFLHDAAMHIEIISGDIDDMLVELAAARNTSVQVKEFALENLGGGFEWLKDAIQDSQFNGRIRFRENDPEPVDVRQVLGLLTLFHPKWTEEKREPIIAYASKGEVLDNYQNEEWKAGYRSLAPIAVTILQLYDYIQIRFQRAYDLYKSNSGAKGRIGLASRKEVRFRERGQYTLKLTQQKSPYEIPDGWTYPMLGAFRMLVQHGSETKFQYDPFRFFNAIAPSMVADVVEESDALGANATAVGKARPLWNSLRKSVEMRRLNIQQAGGEEERIASSPPDPEPEVILPEPPPAYPLTPAQQASLERKKKRDQVKHAKRLLVDK